MIPVAFDYHRPSSVDEAIELLSDDAKLLAGGHSLLPAMKLRLSAPGALIDIGRLAELNYIREDGGTIAIGATTTHYQIESSGLVSANASALAQAASVIGDPQVRNKGTIGGSLAHADPAADYPAAILALGAEIVVKGPDGERSIPADEFFIDLFLTALAPDEIITEVRVLEPRKSRLMSNFRIRPRALPSSAALSPRPVARSRSPLRAWPMRPSATPGLKRPSAAA